VQPDKALLAQLPDPRRCKDANPAAALDTVIRKHPWFRFGFRAGNRRISCDYAADPTGKRPGGTLLVTRIMTVPGPGRTAHTTGPSGDAPPMTISKLLRQLDGPAPDLSTLWVSRHKNAPAPLPFGDLVAAALIKLCGAEATLPEEDGAVGLAQRALGSDLELETLVGRSGGAPVILRNTGNGTVSLHNPGRRPETFLSLAEAMGALRKQHRAKLAPAKTQFDRASHDNRRLGDGPWVDTKTLRKLVFAAIEEIAGRS
jgi:hypothetical protein